MSPRLPVLMILIGLAACQAGEPDSAGVRLVENARLSGLPTVVEFGAASCASCREMQAVMDRTAHRLQGRAHVLVVDISKDWSLAQRYRIQLMPTQVFFTADGRESSRHMGKLDDAEISARLGLPI